jgi:hypothetical protein
MKSLKNSLLGCSGVALVAFAVTFSPLSRAEDAGRGECMRNAAQEHAEAMRACAGDEHPHQCRAMAKEAFEAAREQCKMIADDDDNEKSNSGNNGKGKGKR